MSKVQEGGIVIGNKKIWTISYADDVALMANNEVGMKQMIRRFERYLRRKGLELNTQKSKIMTLKKAGGRRKKMNLYWKREQLEVVRKFEYLDYTLKKNNKEEDHIKKSGSKNAKGYGKNVENS